MKLRMSFPKYCLELRVTKRIYEHSVIDIHKMFRLLRIRRPKISLKFISSLKTEVK